MPDKMDPHFKQRWVTALRSGNFPQTTYSLHNKTGYCCLGVACEIDVRIERVHSMYRWNEDKTAYAAVEDPRFDTASSPTYRMIEMWGLDRDTANHLQELNDNGMSFAEIADWIEVNL